MKIRLICLLLILALFMALAGCESLVKRYEYTSPIVEYPWGEVRVRLLGDFDEDECVTTWKGPYRLVISIYVDESFMPGGGAVVITDIILVDDQNNKEVFRQSGGSIAIIEEKAYRRGWDDERRAYSFSLSIPGKESKEKFHVVDYVNYRVSFMFEVKGGEFSASDRVELLLDTDYKEKMEPWSL